MRTSSDELNRQIRELNKALALSEEAVSIAVVSCAHQRVKNRYKSSKSINSYHQVVTVVVATARTAAAAYTFVIGHTFVLMSHRISMYFSVGSGSADVPSKVPLSVWNVDAIILIHLSPI